MKRNIIIAASFYLIFMFLVYSGIFLNKTDPAAVTKFYLECLRNREGFLTYSISAPGYFNPDKYNDIYKKYKMGNIASINLRLPAIKGHLAYVETKIIYKDNSIINAVAELEREGKFWFMRKIKYD